MIRPTTYGETEFLVNMSEATGMFKPIEVQALREVLHDYFTVEQANGHICVTCEENGEVQGFAYYAPASMTEGTWYLYWIVVRTDIQARGVGTRLLKHMEADIRDHQGRVVFIETGSLPHYDLTRKFYLKNGYEQHALLKDYYAVGDSLVFFRKELS
ncbi:MAG TPA: GNAT family N-acetyltransferase [bacterium]|jgi:ribosomal protein S18 acetylase RimI-like enzyme|nr:GNAT family N-acetyltransferase [bacterium]